MSEPEPIDLSQLQNLQFRPDWVDDLAQKDTGEVVWGKVSGDALRRERDAESRGPRRFDRGGERRPFPGGQDRRGPRPGPRPQGGGGAGGAGQERRGPRPDRRPEGPRRDGPPGDRRDFRGPRPQGGDRTGPREDRGRPPFGKGRPPFHRGEEREGPAPLAGWEARLVADPRSVEAVARQMKATGYAYSVFDVARLFLQDRARYQVKFVPMRSRPPQGKPGGEAAPAAHAAPAGPTELFQCTADGSLWLSREEAVRHVLNSPAIDQFYRKESITLEAPKGNFTAVAVCGFSGVLLGPPNHHDFQRNVARLHRERFANLPLERYKSRIRVEKDEATLQKWQESQTSATQFIPLPEAEVAEGAEAKAPLKSVAEMEAHFRSHHAAAAVVPVTSATVAGNIPGRCLAGPLLALLRQEVERQQRFPMQLVQDLCRDLEGHGLRFFKKDRKATFVSRNRPHYLADDVVLGDRVRSIVEMVRANPGITYTRLVATLAPHIEVKSEAAPAEVDAATPTETAAAPVSDATAEAPAPEATVAPVAEPAAELPAAVAEVAPQAVEAGPVADVEAVAVVSKTEAAADATTEVTAETAAPESTSEPVATEAAEVAAAEPTDATATGSAAEPAPALTPEEIAILQDLRWLVGEGYVTEFQNGELFVLGRPPLPPSPPKPRKAPADDPRKGETAAAPVAPLEGAEVPAAEAPAEAEAVAPEAVEAAPTDAAPAVFAESTESAPEASEAAGTAE